MKKRTIIFLCYITFCISVVAQNSFVANLTPNMKRDITTINNHIRVKSSAAIMEKNIENLLFHMVPNRGLTSEENVHIGHKLQCFPEYYDLFAACRLSLANTKMKNKKGKDGEDLLNGMEFHIQSKNNEHPSAFQDFICAISKFKVMIPEKADGVSKLGKDAPTVASKSSIIKDVLFIRSELRRLKKNGIKPSKDVLANDLFKLAIKDLFKNDFKESIPLSILSEETFTKINNVMCKKLDMYIRQWIELKYAAEYILNPVKIATGGMSDVLNKERNEKKIYADIRELSAQGYGPASYRVGVDFEHAYKLKNAPQEAAEKYQLAHNQGSTAGTIRLAHCLVVGYGCDINLKRAYELLRPLTQDVEFAQNGAYAYALLLENGYGNDADIIDIMQYYTMAAEKEINYTLREAAQKRVNQLYEKNYK